MAKVTEKQAVQLYNAALKLSGAAMAEQPGLPDRAELYHLACAFISANLVTGKSGGNAVDHAGGDNESFLQDAYETGGQVGR
jgi:hypothetical protein